MVRREEYEYLLRRSRQFFETAEIQLERGFYDLAAFSLEQSLQLFLKAALLKFGLEYPRTHSVRRLLELLHEVTGREEVRKIIREYILELGLLEDAYIASRYVIRDYGRDEVLKLKRAVQEVMNAVRRITD